MTVCMLHAIWFRVYCNGSGCTATTGAHPVLYCIIGTLHNIQHVDRVSRQSTNSNNNNNKRRSTTVRGLSLLLSEDYFYCTAALLFKTFTYGTTTNQTGNAIIVSTPCCNADSNIQSIEIYRVEYRNTVQPRRVRGHIKIYEL
jgi:hypothetical protein